MPARMRLAPLLLAGMIAVGACGDGTGGATASRDTAEPRTTAADSTDTTAPPETATSTTAAPEPPSLIVAGDSIVYDVAPALAQALETVGASVTSLVTPSLASESSRTALAQQIDESDPDVVVVMVGVWERAHVTAGGFGLGDPSFAAEYVGEALDPLRQQLATIDARLVILGPPHIRIADDDAQLAQLEAIWADYAADHADTDFVDSDSWLIDSDVFVDIDTTGAAPVRIRRLDGLHLCEEGARRIAAGVLDLLAVEPAPGWENGPWTERFPADECPPPG